MLRFSEKTDYVVCFLRKQEKPLALLPQRSIASNCDVALEAIPSPGARSPVFGEYRLRSLLSPKAGKTVGPAATTFRYFELRRGAGSVPFAARSFAGFRRKPTT